MHGNKGCPWRINLRFPFHIFAIIYVIIYLYIYASKTLSATKLNPEKKKPPLPKTKQPQGCGNFLRYPASVISPVAMERSRSTIQEIPKVSATSDVFFFGSPGVGGWVSFGSTPHLGCQSPRGDKTFFGSGIQRKTVICDWHPGWGVDQKVSSRWVVEPTLLKKYDRQNWILSANFRRNIQTILKKTNNQVMYFNFKYSLTRIDNCCLTFCGICFPLAVTLGSMIPNFGLGPMKSLEDVNVNFFGSCCFRVKNPKGTSSWSFSNLFSKLVGTWNQGFVRLNPLFYKYYLIGRTTNYAHMWWGL